jgi:hypothetical protein
VSASTLRAAAALIRQRATLRNADTAAVLGLPPWTATARFVYHSGGNPIAEAVGPTTAEHIASWHPTVALAVADLIDTILKVGPVDGGAEWDATVTLARTYLGEPA